MRIIYSLVALASSSFAAAQTDPVRPQSRSVTVWSWPLAHASPKPLAKVHYKVHPAAGPAFVAVPSNASVESYTPPEVPYDDDDDGGDGHARVRIGLYDPSSKAWTGSVTSAASFDPRYQRKLFLHTDHDGNVYSASLASYAKVVDKEAEREQAREARKAARAAAKGSAYTPKPTPQSKAKKAAAAAAAAQANEPLVVALVPIVPGPKPVLNKPVVLSADGKAPTGEPEKTFLQKYWWAIAIFLAVQLFAGGSGQSEGK